ncbi:MULTISPECIES: hypothetical protein [Lysinibacillus]|uniref:hypothetical protein n=1 Tax=Lysinibacillus TaxID=400634 RepID=UPI00056656AA|nr:hypothetical protein [Lysinibacillus sphaericus]
MKKKALVALGLIVSLVIILLVIPKVVLNNEHTNNAEENETLENYQIVDEDFNKTVDVPFSRITSFRGNANSIFMSADHKSSSGLDNKIIQYNRKTQKYKTIFNSKFELPSVQGLELNDNWLVWVDSDETGSQKNAYSMNLNTNEIQPLTQENDPNINNAFPVLVEDYAAWISIDSRTSKPKVMLKNLKTNETESIFDLNTYTFMNMFLSAKDGKILFTDKKNNVGYLYLYDVKSKEIKEIKTDYELIGWASMLNDQQLIYLTFNDPSESKVDKRKLLFYNISNKHTQEVVSDVLNVNALYTDFNNQVFFSYNDKYLIKFKLENNLLVENSELETPDVYRFSADNDIYIINQDLSDEKRKSKLIIQSELSN